ncbi:MAG: TetR/AcrR family transcriptional regulator [Spirulinaceae cyanobacterium SM2_1_0]|nr:TetR/AcrR family transcriptional regulator [Spirulinaceae cyanobacterium SM2_1_0]
MPSAPATKASIIEQAARLFNQQGYAGTSMSDLMRATGLQKGGLYNHFRSKEELAIAAFDHLVQYLQQQSVRALRGKRHALDRFMAVLSVHEQIWHEPLIQGGCPILNTASESDDTQPVLRDRARQAMDTWRQFLHRILAKGIARGELPATTDTEAVVTMAIATLEGAVMLSKLYDDPAYLQRAIAQLRVYLSHHLTVPR